MARAIQFGGGADGLWSSACPHVATNAEAANTATENARRGLRRIRAVRVTMTSQLLGGWWAYEVLGWGDKWAIINNPTVLSEAAVSQHGQPNS